MSEISKPKKIFFIISGILSIFFAVIGVFVPVLPTTPFLLLAAYLFAQSSPKMYYWVLHNRLFGRYIRDYQEGRGIPLRTKVISIIFLWLTISWSIYSVDNIYIRIGLLGIAITVTFYLSKKKTYRKSDYID